MRAGAPLTAGFHGINIVRNGTEIYFFFHHYSLRISTNLIAKYPYSGYSGSFFSYLFYILVYDLYVNCSVMNIGQNTVLKHQARKINIIDFFFYITLVRTGVKC